MIDKRRVVVTGVGVLAANGVGKDDFWSSLIEGKSGIRRATLCDVTGLDSRIAGEVPGFDPERFLAPCFKPRHVSRTAQLALAAMRLAVDDAALGFPAMARSGPVLISLGISMGGLDIAEREIRRMAAKGLAATRPSGVGSIHVASASLIAEFIGIPARINTISNSCVGGLDAIMDAARQVREGAADVALAGAADASVVSSLMSGLCAARMLSTRNDQPERASRPFDLHRDRGVLAEGSAVLVLETLDGALARGAMPYMEVIAGADAVDAPARVMSGLEICIREALAHAGLSTGDIGYIQAHGPSDRDLDRAECACIRSVWGRHAMEIPVTSIKGCTGNALAAAGAMQMAAAALAFRHRAIPPTANHEVTDPACALDIVATRARACRPRHALIHAHGIGHVNAAAVVRSIEPS